MRIHPEAAREARAARSWYAKRNRHVGARFLKEFERAMEAIEENPERYAVYLRARRFLFSRFPYSLIYHVTIDGEAEVLAVAHHRRRPGYWRRRMP